MPRAPYRQNVHGPERWASIAGGLGLLALAARPRRPVPRLLMAVSGLTLAGRGLTGYCAIKAALRNGGTREAIGDGAEGSRRSYPAAAMTRPVQAPAAGRDLPAPAPVRTADPVDVALELTFPASDPPAFVASR